MTGLISGDCICRGLPTPEFDIDCPQHGMRIEEYKQILIPKVPTQIYPRPGWKYLRNILFDPGVPVATEADELHRAEREGIARGAQDSPAASGE